MSNQLFGRSFLEHSEEKRLKDAEKLLLDKGYTIRSPLPVTNITTSSKLVKYFYNTMISNNPMRKVDYISSQKSDKAHVSTFVKKGKSVGKSEQVIYAEAKLIIDTAFKYEKNLGLETPITSMFLLSQDWFLNKIRSIINNEAFLSEKENFEEFVSIMSKECESEKFNREYSKYLDELHEKVVGYGKKD